MKKLFNRSILTWILSFLIILTGICFSRYIYSVKAESSSDGMYVEVNSTYLRTSYTIPSGMKWDDIKDPLDKCFWTYPGVILKTNFSGSLDMYCDTNPSSNDFTNAETGKKVTSGAQTTYEVVTKASGAIRYSDLGDKVFYIHVRFNKNGGGSFTRTYPVFTSSVESIEEFTPSWETAINKDSDEQTVRFSPVPSTTTSLYPSYNQGFEVYSTADKAGKTVVDYEKDLEKNPKDLWNKYQAAFRTRSTAANSGQIEVLNVFPDIAGSDQLKDWMRADPVHPLTLNTFGVTPTYDLGVISLDTGYDRDLINVTECPISQFTGDGLEKYDVVAFGSWDVNNDLDISSGAYEKVDAWMKENESGANHNIILGHDTCIDQYPEKEGIHHTYLTKLAVTYLGLEPKTRGSGDITSITSIFYIKGKPMALYSPWFDGHLTHLEDPSIPFTPQGESWHGTDLACYFSGLGSTIAPSGSHVTQTSSAEQADSSFLKYPWNIYMNNTESGINKINYLDVPICHTTGQEFKWKTPSKSYLAFYNRDYTRKIDSPFTEVGREGDSYVDWSSVRDSKNLAYLTVNDLKSAALIQTGHSSGMAIEQEKQIWANLIFALCSKSKNENEISAPIVDSNVPEIKSGVYNSDSKSLDLSTFDHGTINYFTINTTDTSKYNFALSKLRDFTWVSGVRGYKYFFSDTQFDETPTDLISFNKRASDKSATVYDYKLNANEVITNEVPKSTSIKIDENKDKKKYCYIISYDNSKRTNDDNPNEETKEPNYSNVIEIKIDDAASITASSTLAGGDYVSNEGDHKVVWNKAGSTKPVIITGTAKAKTGEVYSLGISLANTLTQPIDSDESGPDFSTTEFAKYFYIDGSNSGYKKSPSNWISKLDYVDSKSDDPAYLFKPINLYVSSSNKKEGIEMKVYTVGSSDKDTYSTIIPSKDSYIQDNTPPEIRATYSNGVGKIDSVIESYNGSKNLASGIKKISYCMKDRSSGNYGNAVSVFTGVDGVRNTQSDNINISDAAHPEKYSGVKIIAVDNVGNQSEKEIPIAYVPPQDPIDSQSSGEIILSKYKYCSKNSTDKWVNKKDNFQVTFNSNVSPTCSKTLAQGMLGGYYDTIDSFSDEVSRIIITRYLNLGMMSYNIDGSKNVTDQNNSTLDKVATNATSSNGLEGNTFNAILNVDYTLNAKTASEGSFPITGTGLATNKASAQVSGYEPYQVYHSEEMGLDEFGNMVITKSAWYETKYRKATKSDFKIFSVSKDYTCPSKLCVDGTEPVFECIKIGRYEASFHIKDTGSGINQILIKGAKSKSEAESKGGTILVKQSTRGSLASTAVESSYDIVKEIQSKDGDLAFPTLQLYSNKDDKKNTSYPYIYYEITDNVGNVTEGTVGPLVTVTEGKITIDGKDSKDYAEVPFNYNTTYPHGPLDVPATSPNLQKDKNLVAVPSTVTKNGKDRKVLDVIGDLSISIPVPGFNPIVRLETKGKEDEINTTSFEKAPAVIEQTIPPLGNISLFRKEIYIDDNYNTPVKPVTKEVRDATYSYLEWEKMTDPKLPYFFTIYSKVSDREDFINEIDTRFPIYFASGYHHDKVVVYNVDGDNVQPNYSQKANPKINKEVTVAEGKPKGLVDTSFLRSGWYKAEITMYDFNGNPSGMTEYWFYHDQPALYTPYRVAITAVKDIDWENLDTKRLDYGETYYRPTDEEGKEVTLDIVNGNDQSKFPLGKVWGASGTTLKRISNGGNPIAKGYAVNWEFCKENNVELKSLTLRYTFKSSTGESLKLMQNGSALVKDFTDKDGSKSYFTEQALTSEQLSTLNQPTLIIGHYGGSPLSSHYNSTVSIKHFLPVNFVAYTSSTNQLYTGPVTVTVRFESTAANSASVYKTGLIQSIDLYTIDQSKDALDDIQTDKQR